MKQDFIKDVIQGMLPYLNNAQNEKLQEVLKYTLAKYEVTENQNKEKYSELNFVELFLSAKRIEGCSEKSLKYYKATIEAMLCELKKDVFLDEQRMCRLYEKFILEYFKKEHPEVKASASQIPWDTDDGYREMLPVMQSDIMLKSGDKTLVIDAKYYAHTTQSQYNTNTLHSGNLYQIFTYVKNLDTSNSGSVAGMLLYAKTDEIVLPNNDYKMGGNQISVKTLDLDCEFAEIKRQLDDIVQRYFDCS